MIIKSWINLFIFIGTILLILVLYSFFTGGVLFGKIVDSGLATTISTLLYTLFTIFLFSTMRKSYTSQSIPIILPKIESLKEGILINLKNISQNPAKNIEIRVESCGPMNNTINFIKKWSNFLDFFFWKKIMKEEFHLLEGKYFIDYMTLPPLPKELGISYTIKNQQYMINVKKNIEFYIRVKLKYSSLLDDEIEEEWEYKLKASRDKGVVIIEEKILT